jgi:hypothetical protein
MRRATAILAAVALSAAGCGGNASSDVESTIHAYLDAFVKGDGSKACSLMTDATRKSFVKRVRPLYKTGDCGKAIDKIRSQAGPAVIGALKGVKVSDVKISGDRATARLNSGVNTSSTRLQKEGGSWRIAAAPGAG